MTHSMSFRRNGTGVAAMVLLASCTSPKAPPPPPPALAPPVVRPAAPAAGDWRDVPLTPGVWRYAGGTADFGPPGRPLFRLACEAGRGTVAVGRPGGTSTQLSLTTSYGRQSFAASAGIAAFRAGDPLLDRLTFSRGRIIVESAGEPRLVIPAQAEIGRVVEDCRG